MQIPEELNKLSEKELKKILKPNIFEAKYIINKEYNRIYEIEAKIGKYVYPKGSRDRIFIGNLQRKDYYEPLTYESLQRFRKENILTKINNWIYSQFQNWCIRQFNDVYGEEFVSVDDNYVTVWFPEVTISNSMEQSHIMRDIYLKFYIDSSQVKLEGLKRGTLTDVEIRNYYTFSHCSNNERVFSWAESFCFGYTQIADLKDNLNTRLKLVKNLRFFLEAIKEYLSWESLEGVPYNKIDNVIYDKNLYTECSTSGYDLEDCLLTVMNNIENFTYSFNFYNSEYFTYLSNSSIEEVSSILEKYYPEQLLPCLNGVSVQRNVIEEEEYDHPQFIWFKNEYRPFKLIKTNSSEIDLPRKINTNLLSEVIEQIQYKYNEFLKQKKINDYKG